MTEARCFYGFQVAIENVHSEMYSLLIDMYIKVLYVDLFASSMVYIYCWRLRAEALCQIMMVNVKINYFDFMYV